LVALAVLGAWLWTEDRWLGAAVALMGLVVFYRGATLGATLDQFGMITLGPSHVAIFALGAVLLAAVRQTPRAWHRHAASLLAALLPLWLLPFAAYAVWAGHSLSALLALAVGLAMMNAHRLISNSRRIAIAAAASTAVGLGAFGSMLYLKGLATPAVAGRFA